MNEIASSQEAGWSASPFLMSGERSLCLPRTAGIPFHPRVQSFPFATGWPVLGHRATTRPFLCCTYAPHPQLQNPQVVRTALIEPPLIPSSRRFIDSTRDFVNSFSNVSVRLNFFSEKARAVISGVFALFRMTSVILARKFVHNALKLDKSRDIVYNITESVAPEVPFALRELMTHGFRSSALSGDGAE